MEKFINREDAAKRLYEILPTEKMKHEAWEIVAVSTDGLEIASYVSERLHLGVDILLSASIVAPHNEECELARVCETEEIVIHEQLCESFDIQVDYVYGEAKRRHEEKILADMYKYRKGEHFEPKHAKSVLLVDEGSETGMKMLLAIKAMLAQQPKAVYVAVPVLPKETLEALEPLVDDIYFIYDIQNYKETKCYYEQLETLEDETVEKILEGQ